MNKNLRPISFFTCSLFLSFLFAGAFFSSAAAITSYEKAEGVYQESDHKKMEAIEIPETQRELRAVWIATVANIDWPSGRGLSSEEQKAELRTLFDRVEQLNMNTVIFQIRPATDALYHSDLEPWSEFLTGKQGLPPEPWYDPLSFAIEEAHKRGMELHAWINPFRSRHPSGRSGLADNHLSRHKPDIVKEYGRYLWMDPGEQASHDWTIRVVRDIIRRYDVDAIHIDDYFYPYRERDENEELIDFPDQESFNKYVETGGEKSRSDWRRDNVNRFIERLHLEIKEENPRVRFGISPIGLWRPDDQGEEIQGFNAYEEIYADSRKWFAKGWLDYFTPQLYWPIDQEGQRYPVLLRWWEEQNEMNRHFWPGNFTSRVRDRGERAWPVSEITEQIRITRKSKGATGNIHFSMSALMNESVPLADSLMALYKEPSLVPETSWIDAEPPGRPSATVKTLLSDHFLEFRPVINEDVWLYVVKAQYGTHWETTILPGWKQHMQIKAGKDGSLPETLVLTAVNNLGTESLPFLLSLKK